MQHLLFFVGFVAHVREDNEAGTVCFRQRNCSRFCLCEYRQHAETGNRHPDPCMNHHDISLVDSPEGFACAGLEIGKRHFGLILIESFNCCVIVHLGCGRFVLPFAQLFFRSVSAGQKKAQCVAPRPDRWPGFLKLSNLTGVANQTAISAIIAIGMTIVIIAAGIDLSVGSLVALAAVIAALISRDMGGAIVARILMVSMNRS